MNQKFTFFFGMILLLISPVILAQNVSISGNITDADTDEPLIGATVVLKNTTNGVATDYDGNFTIDNVGINEQLVISYIGYITKEVEIENSSFLNITLGTDAQLLEEFVVVHIYFHVLSYSHELSISSYHTLTKIAYLQVRLEIVVIPN